ncbi:hypothetical protein F53441_13772 [Fusarium austroafricanum]|uniref:DUF676 domain-containing protein n=1 Tax=Fusarium austroafricanum TaxID=2364996 RepID=A0A8H4JNE8_9HYPO|nr:hypothetical protein F53441_13772 [Fusarium austroafricanum]
MSAGSYENFRIRGIPLEYETRAAVRDLVKQTLALEPSARLTVYSLAVSPGDQNSRIATLSFLAIPDSLSDRSKSEWIFPLLDGDDIDFSKSIVFDTHFAGFTPFQRTSDNDCHVDVIAVCGLGGHALDSFKEKNGPFVWLRDALPLDIPHARILTYGYDTQIIESSSFQNLMDLGRALRVDLEGIYDENHPRPIAFVGHSLGGLVIKEAIVRLKEEPLVSDMSILDAISGFAFFGVPHQGLAVRCLVPLVKDYPNRGLIESLNTNSALLDRLEKEFRTTLGAKGSPVISFYETQRSPTAVKASNGKWEMTGPSEGTPGSGKSKLMKFAVEMMNRRKAGETLVSFFIHRRRVPLQRPPIGLFRALLNSILRSFPSCLAKLTERFNDREERYGSFERKNGWCWAGKELEEFLSFTLVKGTKSQPVVIFVDALDECGEDAAKQLLVYFKNVMNDVEREGAAVRICFSSRHYPVLGLETLSTVFVQERNDKDIRLVIQDRLKEVQPPEKRQQIETDILLKAQGGVQWSMLITSMILDDISHGARTETLYQKITVIPEDLNDLYAVILKTATKSKSHQEEQEMVKFFQWVLFAERPLSAQELRKAFATDKDMACKTVSELRHHPSWSKTLAQFELRVRHISDGLVELQTRDVWELYELGGRDWNREAQFIHQSAADFILQQFLSRVDYGSPFRSTTGTGHFEISRSCFRYLTLTQVLEGGQFSQGRLSTMFPLLLCGVAYILHHIEAVEVAKIPQTDLLTLIHWNRPDHVRMLATLWRTMDPDNNHVPVGWPFAGASPLHVLVGLGSASYLDSFLQKDETELDARDADGNTPLVIALREGRPDLALLLLKRSIAWQAEQDEIDSRVSLAERGGCRKNYLSHINSTNVDDETPLSVAVSSRTDKTTSSSADAGADATNEKGLLFYAINRRTKTLLSRLISKGENLDGAVFYAIQSLVRTHDVDYERVLREIVSDLLDAGANTSKLVGFRPEYENQDDDSFSDEWEEEEDEEILVSTRNRLRPLISLLLSHGASATAKDRSGDFPLMLATRNNDLETVKLLLHAAPQAVQMENNHGEMPLVIAVRKKLHEMAKILLATGKIDINIPIPASDHLSSFWMTVRDGGTRMVKLLLDSAQVDINQENIHGETPFWWALKRHNGTAKVLIDTGKIDMNQKNEFEDTPLGWAIKCNNIEIAKAVLDTGQVDINQKNDLGQTSFWYMAMFYTVETARLLLDTGRVDINQKNNLRQTPIWWAIENGIESLVELLLKTGQVDINQRNAAGKTTFCLVEMLLDANGFDINEEDEFGPTALWWAVDQGIDRGAGHCSPKPPFAGMRRFFEAILETNRANIDAIDTNGSTLLSLAAQGGNVAIIQLLLDTSKVDINARDLDGRMPVYWAAFNGCEEAVQFLLSTGMADMDLADSYGYTPISIVGQRRDHETVDFTSDPMEMDADNRS